MCCTWVGVQSLGKLPGERCKHLGPNGCTIYDTRPDECRIFNCAWLLGVGDQSVRPDRLGGVVTGNPQQRMIVIFGPDDELEKRSAYVRKLLAKQARRGHGLAFISGGGPARVLGPEAELEGLIAGMREVA